MNWPGLLVPSRYWIFAGQLNEQAAIGLRIPAILSGKPQSGAIFASGCRHRLNDAPTGTCLCESCNAAHRSGVERQGRAAQLDADGFSAEHHALFNPPRVSDCLIGPSAEPIPAFCIPSLRQALWRFPLLGQHHSHR